MVRRFWTSSDSVKLKIPLINNRVYIKKVNGYRLPFFAFFHLIKRNAAPMIKIKYKTIGMIKIVPM